MEKAIVKTEGATVTLEADQRVRRMKLTLQYKGTKQVAELDTVNDIAVKIWINSRLNEFFDFHYHTTAHKDPLNYRHYRKQLKKVVDKVQRAVFEDDDLLMVVDLSELLADFLEEDEARLEEEDAHGVY